MQQIKDKLSRFIQNCTFETIQNNGVQLFAMEYEIPFSKSLIELSEALEKKLIEVVEVSESGSVNDLKVQNPSDYFLLIYEGSLLVGEKQTRIVNATLLLQPQSETIIPVSCVEQGRWDRQKKRI